MYFTTLGTIFFTFSGFLLDSVDYITDAILGSPRWTDQGREKSNKVWNLLFPLDNGLFVLAYFFSFELERIAQVAVSLLAYLCACRKFGAHFDLEQVWVLLIGVECWEELEAYNLAPLLNLNVVERVGAALV